MEQLPTSDLEGEDGLGASAVFLLYLLGDGYEHDSAEYIERGQASEYEECRCETK